MKKGELAKEGGRILVTAFVTTALIQSSIGQQLIPKLVDWIEKGRQKANV